MTNLLTFSTTPPYATVGLTTACISTTRASLKPSLNLRRQPILFSGGAPSVRTEESRRRRAAAKFVTRAGPSANSYIFAFVFPLSLLVVTIFTSIKIADKLDKDFLEELAMQEAMKEAAEEDEEDGVDETPPAERSLPSKEPALPRTRNRPKREA